MRRSRADGGTGDRGDRGGNTVNARPAALDFALGLSGSCLRDPGACRLRAG